MITWDKSMETGVEQIDNQHKNLIEKFNELLAAIDNGQKREKTGEVLDYLVFYADWHFQREEACMEAYGCPIAAANKEQHGYFLERFSQLQYDFYDSSMDPCMIDTTINELKDWIVNHIIGTDTALRQCAIHGSQTP